MLFLDFLRLLSGASLSQFFLVSRLPASVEVETDFCFGMMVAAAVVEDEAVGDLESNDEPVEAVTAALVFFRMLGGLPVLAVAKGLSEVAFVVSSTVVRLCIASV